MFGIVGRQNIYGHFFAIFVTVGEIGDNITKQIYLTKTNSQIFKQATFDFPQEAHIFLLFRLGKQLKMHSSFVKTTIHEN